MPGKCGRGCGCNKHDKESCCDAIEKAMGKYFLESAQVANTLALEAQFTDLIELIARTQLYEQFLVQQNSIIRNALVALSNCNSDCCAGAAAALADSGLGYVNLAFQAVLAKGNPLIAEEPALSLQQVLALVAQGSQETVAAILSVAGCIIPQ